MSAPLCRAIRGCADGDGVFALLDEHREADVAAFTAACAALGCAGACDALPMLSAKLKERCLAPTEPYLSAVITAYGRNGRVDDALGVLDRMREHHGVAPGPSSYAAAISVCGHSEQCERALSVLGMARRQCPRLGAATYTAAIAACGRCREWERGVQVLDGHHIFVATQHVEDSTPHEEDRSRRGLDKGEIGAWWAEQQRDSRTEDRYLAKPAPPAKLGSAAGWRPGTDPRKEIPAAIERTNSQLTQQSSMAGRIAARRLQAQAARSPRQSTALRPYTAGSVGDRRPPKTAIY